ncbi:hypothetical protein [Cryobacterium sp. TMB1-7]|uniref:hypothetical protein n=1 Tax=Cryobacterium sp. TMB1-7 TaxID=2555866 RepID=UPI00106D9821|nr:hypothetical protein [Cryobacterium sp. TMB1-7]TFC63048.1 hypothetical protein E3O60_00540 [Cryobacterium sp. TMB1-7]
MKKQASQAEIDKEIRALRGQAVRLWTLRKSRLTLSLLLPITAVLVMSAGVYITDMAVDIPAGPGLLSAFQGLQTVQGLLKIAFAVEAVIILSCGIWVYIESVRLRFKLKNIGLTMRRLDPNAGLLATGLEEILRSENPLSELRS